MAEIKKIFVGKEGVVVLLCPHCGNVKKEAAANYTNNKEPVEIQCTCGKEYTVKIEFRQNYRKMVNLEGTYKKIEPPPAWGKIIINNISMGGCGFDILSSHALKMEDLIGVEFNLDDRQHSLIRKAAKVCIIEGRYIGCKFDQLPGYIDRDLGFYLRS